MVNKIPGYGPKSSKDEYKDSAKAEKKQGWLGWTMRLFKGSKKTDSLINDAELFTTLEKVSGKAKEKLEKAVGDFPQIGGVEEKKQKSEVPEPVAMLNPPEGRNKRQVSCYMNASMQALFASPEFLKAAKNPPSSEDGCEIIRIRIEDLLEAREENNPAAIRRAMKALRLEVFKSPYGPNKINELQEQQDAQDFMSAILKAVGLGYELQAYSRHNLDGEEMDLEEGVPDYQTMLQVPIVGKNYGIQKLIDIEFEPTEERKQQLVKKMVKAPSMLVVRLRREEYDEKTEITKKIIHPVSFSKKVTLKSKSFTGEDTRYRLKGFVNHIGEELKSGHYISRVKCGDSWYLCDDNTIEKEKDVIIEERKYGDPYLFVFEKTD